MSTVQIVVTIIKHTQYKAVLLTQRQHNLFVGITEGCISVCYSYCVTQIPILDPNCIPLSTISRAVYCLLVIIR